jgi:phospholipid N-methyltransferase
LPSVVCHRFFDGATTLSSYKETAHVTEKENRRRTGTGKGDGLAFLMGFLKRPGLVGSVIPSSRFLEQRLAELVTSTGPDLVVELGPGTGGTTRAVLAALPAQSKLLAIEISPEFVARLSSHPDPRLIVHHGSAQAIGEALSSRGLGQPSVVFSGIPFSTIPRRVGEDILKEIWTCLAPGGRFIAYQFRSRVAELGRALLGKPETEIEILNAPPVRLFQWRKPSADALK